MTILRVNFIKYEYSIKHKVDYNYDSNTFLVNVIH